MPRNGTDHECVALLDQVRTISVTALGARIGFPHPGQERELTAARHHAFDLV